MRSNLAFLKFRIFWIEFFAVIFNLLFTFLYLKGNVWCYVFGVLGPFMFIYLCYSKKLYSETFLQVFYVAMAICGFFNLGNEWHIDHWPIQKHIPYLISGVLITILVAFYLKKKTDAKLPLADTFTTVFAIIGTWLMMNYVHENWLYFIVINAVSLVIYPLRGMWLASFMFLIYLLMSIDGYFESIQWF
jgi:nicotinamide mononucleotide transporter